MVNILDPVRNISEVIVSIGYDDTATAIALQSGEGSKLPDVTTEGAFNMPWYNTTDYDDPSLDPNYEIVRVIARGGDNLTVVRAQEGTTASTKNTTDKAYRMFITPTKKSRDDVENKINESLSTSIAQLLHPVGTIYSNGSDPTNPATLLGFGTWVLWGIGRVPVCIDAGDADFDTVGETGGAKTHTLTEAELASHNHTYVIVSGGGSVGAAGVIDNAEFTNTGSTGGDGAHNNVQPYIVEYRWIRTV